MNLIPFRNRPSQELVRSSNDPVLSFDDFVGLVTQFSFNGVQYTQPGQAQEQIPPLFLALARGAYKSNGIVFACMAARQMLLSEARFCFRQRRNGRPGDLFTTADLAPLEAPWPGATTGDLISRMELYASLGGNWFGTNRYGGIRSLRPDWMKIILGSENDAIGWDPDAVPVGYAYEPGGPGSGQEPVFFLPEEIAHYAPYPDPEAQFRGMSWLTPILREVMSDKAATDHKLAFFENGATPNMVVKMEVSDIQQWVDYIRKFSAEHEGVRNAYKTMYLGAGMDATVVGTNLQQMDFKVTQGAGETRIAAAARVPAAIAQISEGLQGSTLNSGNFDSSMRLFADLMARPTWRNMAGSLSTLITVPGGSELWYDDRDIPALKEDIKKAGERIQADTASMSALFMAGWDPDAIVEAVTSGDLTRLTGKHAGPLSVQVQAAGLAAQPSDGAPADGADGNGNGNGNGGANGKRSEDLLSELLAHSRRDRTLEIHNHLPEQAPVNVTVEPSHITTEAARAPDVHVTVEPAVVEFGEGSVRLDAPITIEPASVTVEAARAPDVNVTVEPSTVTVEPAQVTVEAAQAPNVEVRVDAPPPAEVNVTVEPSTLTVEAAQPPDIHLHVPERGKPPNAHVTRGEDGSMTVRYDDEESTDGS